MLNEAIKQNRISHPSPRGGITKNTHKDNGQDHGGFGGGGMFGIGGGGGFTGGNAGDVDSGGCGFYNLDPDGMNSIGNLGTGKCTIRLKHRLTSAHIIHLHKFITNYDTYFIK